MKSLLGQIIWASLPNAKLLAAASSSSTAVLGSGIGLGLCRILVAGYIDRNETERSG